GLLLAVVGLGALHLLEGLAGVTVEHLGLGLVALVVVALRAAALTTEVRARRHRPGAGFEVVTTLFGGRLERDRCWVPRLDDAHIEHRRGPLWTTHRAMRLPGTWTVVLHADGAPLPVTTARTREAAEAQLRRLVVFGADPDARETVVEGPPATG